MYDKYGLDLNDEMAAAFRNGTVVKETSEAQAEVASTSDSSNTDAQPSQTAASVPEQKIKLKP